MEKRSLLIAAPLEDQRIEKLIIIEKAGLIIWFYNSSF
jgi:hypothetical protein